jgi:hypothetical protein
MPKALDYRIVKAADNRPLVILESALGNGHEIRPDELRRLADALLKIADQADAKNMGRGYMATKSATTY